MPRGDELPRSIRLLLMSLVVLVPCLALRSGLAQHSKALTTPPASDDELQVDNPHHDALFGANASTQGEHSHPLPPRQRASLMRSNLEKSKKDAVELAALAKELRDELSVGPANTASPEIIERVERIEKLARKIRDETTGY